MNQSAENILQIINKVISLNQGNIFQLRKDFEQLYLKFSSNQAFQVEKQKIGKINGFKIYGENINNDYLILFFHGEYFMTGSTKDHLDLCGKLSNLSSVPVLSVDYRLAPEHKFPAPHENCITAYLWLLKQGMDPSKIVIAGISAGGTLVLSTLLFLRNNGVKLPAGGVCMSPLVDMLFQGHSIITNGGKDWVTQEMLDNLRKIYIKGYSPTNPLVFPIYADLHRLPPIMIQVGSHELLLDDIIRFHKKAKDSEVEMTFELWKDMFHCFQMFSSNIPEGQAALETAGTYIKKMLSI
ncbi:alpha/beta hydrolase [Methanobacterium oryzae]|uniref:alpha/beta hydrolase n=1 Tax=Methanobacterium oryzae TaxID=69540 RepID=UPI003D20D71C